MTTSSAGAPVELNCSNCVTGPVVLEDTKFVVGTVSVVVS